MIQFTWVFGLTLASRCTGVCAGLIMYGINRSLLEVSLHYILNSAIIRRGPFLFGLMHTVAGKLCFPCSH